MSDETLLYHLAPQHESRNYRLCPEQGAKFVKMMVAEFIGTFIMVFGSATTPVVDAKYPNVETLIGKAASSGISVAIVIFSTGHISGAHLNPAVTIAFALFKNFPFACVPLYIVAQVLGSICASTVLSFIFDPVQDGGVTVPTISTSRAFILEFVITFILLFVVTAVTFDSEANQKLAAIAVGLTVLLNSLIAGPSTGASMNPVRTLGPALVSGNYDRIWIYIAAPILGAIFGTSTYDYMKLA
ncbi:NOD26-like intrinsic protein 1 [Rhynchospora pubera]|uniref:NOD26-like intrinsic protein 1 n=1 Tax=Rhynchospora pubera TaxID=906938 RepID=A0AAV8DZ18_9POAL|nr:NOD26-like intrinsic protein 1 [Rhynchospora pubera]KAJ4780159.1 NOD26-like intrinsic protein 1 [Rhynchospora pubera]